MAGAEPHTLIELAKRSEPSTKGNPATTRLGSLPLTGYRSTEADCHREKLGELHNTRIISDVVLFCFSNEALPLIRFANSHGGIIQLLWIKIKTQTIYS